MRVFLCRHGQAVARAASDDQRPLTETGRAALLNHWQVMRDAGISPRGLLVSPYLRAQQTADCIDQVYGTLPRTSSPCLVPDAPIQRLFDELLTLPDLDGQVLVSHMPLVAQFTAEWIGQPARIVFDVGTVACFDVEVAAANGARLLWLRSPGDTLGSH